jgi:heme-degrading monooxygenase HmoA
MSEVYTTGSWKPNPASEQAFVDAWSEFATWASNMPGAGSLRLVRDLHEPGRFVSFGDWGSSEAVRAWKSSPEFRERMAQVLQHVEEFHPTELALVATAEHGAVDKRSPVEVG